MKKYSDYRLCFVDEGNFYFSNEDARKIKGDGWNKFSYEHNCDFPSKENYDWIMIRAFKEGAGNEEDAYYKIEEPYEKFEYNSPYSVYDINSKLTPWAVLNIRKKEEISFSEKIPIFANDTLEDVLELFKKYNVDYIIKEYGLFL